MIPEHRDRVLDWHLELRRLEPHLLELPTAARRLLAEITRGFEAEDSANAPHKAA